MSIGAPRLRHAIGKWLARRARHSAPRFIAVHPAGVGVQARGAMGAAGGSSSAAAAGGGAKPEAVGAMNRKEREALEKGACAAALRCPACSV